MLISFPEVEYDLEVNEKDRTAAARIDESMADFARNPALDADNGSRDAETIEHPLKVGYRTS